MLRPNKLARALGGSVLAAVSLWIAPAGCSLSNVAHDACEGDAECAAAFGVGSACNEGYCSDAGACATGHDCREKYGGGACVDGACKLFVPEDDACTIVEPPDLLKRPLAGDGAVLVIGAIFAKDDKKNEATADAVRLAVTEINKGTGVANGQSLGLVVCDNGGPGNKASGDDRVKLDQHAFDYLAGTLGVPFLVGPRTSSDALAIVARIVEKKLPTVVISPSATSPELTGVPSRIVETDAAPLFWRTCPSDALQGKVLAEDVVGQDPAIASATVVYTNDAYGKGLSEVFLDSFGAAKSNLVAFDAAKLGDGATPGALAGQVKQQNPDAVVIVATSAQDTVVILDALDKAALTGKKYFFTDGSKDATHLLDSKLSTGVKAMVAGAKGTAPASARDPATFKFFTASLGLAFPGIDPTAYSFLAHAYDATYLGAYGVVYAQNKAAAKDPKKAYVFDGRTVAEGLTHLTSGTKVEVGTDWPQGKQTLTTAKEIDLDGISGELTLDPKLGEGPAPIEIWTIDAKGTGFTTIATIP
jgi:branched-chain amino acid transport system substrate-binding protein